jgi:hypothetical protein
VERSESAFRDETELEVVAGKGGDGAISFLREKFVQRGGPDGVDGGDGGRVFLLADPHENSLFRIARMVRAEAEGGRQGGAKNCFGRSGADCTVHVPVGTQVFDAVHGNLLVDLTEAEQEIVVARGGRGGRGNARFASSTQQTPHHAEDGAPGEIRRLRLELKLMADVGIVGLPNAGKSTLLRRLTSARPRVGAYPFTTLHPALGVLSADGGERTLVLAVGRGAPRDGGVRPRAVGPPEPGRRHQDRGRRGRAARRRAGRGLARAGRGGSGAAGQRRHRPRAAGVGPDPVPAGREPGGKGAGAASESRTGRAGFAGRAGLRWPW